MNPTAFRILFLFGFMATSTLVGEDNSNFGFSVSYKNAHLILEISNLTDQPVYLNLQSDRQGFHVRTSGLISSRMLDGTAMRGRTFGELASSRSKRDPLALVSLNSQGHLFGGDRLVFRREIELDETWDETKINVSASFFYFTESELLELLHESEGISSFMAIGQLAREKSIVLSHTVTVTKD